MYLSIEILREEANIGIVDLRDDLLQLVNGGEFKHRSILVITRQRKQILELWRKENMVLVFLHILRLQTLWIIVDEMA